VRLPDLREPRALPKWLMQVAHHESYRWKRQSQRTLSRDDPETDLPEPATPAIAESLLQQTQEADVARSHGDAEAAMPRLVELLFLETPAAYTEVAAELDSLWLHRIYRQKCLSGYGATRGTGF